MKSIRMCLFVFLIASGMLTSCTARYQQLLHERDMTIKELHTQVAELSATNQDLENTARGARQRVNSLSQRLAAREKEPAPSLDDLNRKLGPDVEARVLNGRLSLGINNRVTFGSGSTALKSSAGGVLRSVARVLKGDFSGRRIIIEGHTDTDPIRRTKNRFRDNRHLSLERADAVAAYLIKKCGVPAPSVVVAGFGPHAPLNGARTKAAKAANRRVEIVIGEMP